MDGLLVIDKPAGLTSHDVVERMRRVLGERRVGHTGTLDPAATGVLPLVIGRATRLARFLSGAPKAYEATIRLGVSTDTYDAEGAPSGEPYRGRWPAREQIDEALDAFRGTFVQQPPAHSAKKIAGERSYDLARRARRPGTRDPERGTGNPEPVSLPRPVSVTVHRLELLSASDDLVTIRVDCSAGFYVRSLAHDLGARLGTGAHLAALRRIRSGDLEVTDALPLARAEADHAAAAAAVVPLERMLPGLQAAVLTEEGAKRAAHGRDLGPADFARPPVEGDRAVRLLNASGGLVGIAEPAAAGGALHPSVVLG